MYEKCILSCINILQATELCKLCKKTYLRYQLQDNVNMMISRNSSDLKQLLFYSNTVPIIKTYLGIFMANFDIATV